MKNETEMIKIISQIEDQKLYLREMVDKLKEEKNKLVLGLHKNADKYDLDKNNLKNKTIGESNNNMLDVNSSNST